MSAPVMAVGVAATFVVLLPLIGPGAAPAGAARATTAAKAAGMIRHVIIVMQENRSFDSYFGTFPGADGIPMHDGVPAVCLPDPRQQACQRPFHDPDDVNVGGAHGRVAYDISVDGGRMDGFIRAARRNDPSSTGVSDVMGYHDAREIPNYWAYARNFVLQDRMFESESAWSFGEHLYLVSEWAAVCRRPDAPMSCRNHHAGPPSPDHLKNLAWTDLTYLLHRYGVSWRYYVVTGKEPDCVNDESVTCALHNQSSSTLSIWNPLPAFTTVRQDHQVDHVQSISSFYSAARAGKLPDVSWIVPSAATSEHPLNRISAGQAFVTTVVNAVMRSSDWAHSAIFVSWDDWGGFYDHVRPPTVDANGYGFRVPGLLISPYAKAGSVDHQTLSHDAYAKLIEDIFLGGRRLDPRTDGRPDPRPTVRDSLKRLGDLRREFDFNQPPRPPLILPTHPPSRPT